MKTSIILLVAVMTFTSSIAQGADSKEVSHYTRATFTCHDGEGVSFKDKKGLPAKAFRKKGAIFCKNRCSKVTKKCGVNSSQITGFAGLYRNDLYRKVKYTCHRVKTIFTESSKSCKTKAQWKKIATKHCRKIVGKLPNALNGYDVSQKCKLRKKLGNELQGSSEHGSSVNQK